MSTLGSLTPTPPSRTSWPTGACCQGCSIGSTTRWAAMTCTRLPSTRTSSRSSASSIALSPRHQLNMLRGETELTAMASTPIDPDRIAAAVSAAYAKHQKNRRGKNAGYIPALAEVDPQLFGICVATVDGQTFSAGDATCLFALESISKVFTAALAMEQVGPRAFHRKVGADPTGAAFNSVLALELRNDKPMSPMVNAGAMTSTSLVSATDADDRWRQILQMQSDFAGRSISVSEQISASERATNFHNRAIAWLLLCGGYMYCDPMEACDVYTLQCSTLVTAVDLAIMGATLANGGINPVTAKRVIARANVSHVLAEMTMEGLYTSSGDWAYTVGLPAKSGVGGGLVAVSPGKLAIAAYSPPLDKAGNSVRAPAAIPQVAHTLERGLFNTPRRDCPPAVPDRGRSHVRRPLRHVASLYEKGFRRYIRGRIDRRSVRSDLGAPGIRRAWG